MLFWVMTGGVAVGVLFDLYRALRSWMGWGRIAVLIGDFIFSLLALVVLFRFFLKANALEFRSYIIWGSILGLLGYMGLFSGRITQGFLMLFSGLARLAQLLWEALLVPFKALVILMRLPYGLLRWFSLLIYRVLEAVLSGPWNRVRVNCVQLWKKIFPPRIDS